MSIAQEGIYSSELLPEQLDGQSLELFEVENVSLNETIPPQEPLCRATESPELILRARQMTASRYLRRRYIQPDEIGSDGTIEDDPVHGHSKYYVDLQGPEPDAEIISTLRKIYWSPEAGDDSFPVWKHKDELFPEAVARIEAVGLDKCVEVSALVKSPKLDTDGMTTLRLYRALFQDTLMQQAQGVDEQVFLMAANPALFEIFQKSFNGYIERIGPDLDYPGQEVIPAMIRPRDGMIDAINSMGEADFDNPQLEFVINYLIDGIDKTKVDPDVAAALDRVEARKAADLGVATVTEAPLTPVDDQSHDDTTRLQEAIKSRRPEIIAGVGLIGYTVLRTVGVAKGISPDTNVDWRVFLGIEVATTPTYVKGMGDLLRSTTQPEDYTRRQKIVAGLMAGSSFLSPYAYVLAEGESMPKTALAGVVAVLGASALSVGAKIRKARRSREEFIPEN